jgi:hypothetical protein
MAFFVVVAAAVVVVVVAAVDLLAVWCCLRNGERRFEEIRVDLIQDCCECYSVCSSCL